MISITYTKEQWNWFIRLYKKLSPEAWVVIVATLMALIATAYSFSHAYIAVYGDAESHLNIAKRVVDSLTPGFAQLGGIWLPIPHLLLAPFVYFNFLWRTGLAGSIVSGSAFIISALYLYKLTFMLTEHESASLCAAAVFMSNPNILYMQSTPMTELTLIVFFILSSYFFIKFIRHQDTVMYLIAAGLFGFLASLSRYDGWALVLMEAGVLVLALFPYKLELPILFKAKNISDIRRALILKNHASPEKLKPLIKKLEGYLVMFGTLAFFGIALWLVWGLLILGDPLYFTHSQFSANSQQHSWLSKDELPAYHSILTAFIYYFVTSMTNSGVVIFLLALAGLIAFLTTKKNSYRFYILLILAVPFIFNVATLFLGQSVIFIPSLTPINFEWRLFNVRYGVMIVPFVAVCVGYLFYRSKLTGKFFIVAVCAFQVGLYLIGYSHVISLQDGTIGLSSQTAKTPDAQYWIAKNYDYGLVLTDDYARTMSIIRTPIPMKDIIYIGNKPYWEESLIEPQKYARWIIMQKDDTVWTHIYDRPEVRDRLFKYFNKVYTSDQILIFRRIDNVN